jgi:hypothetical protein
MPPIMGHGDSVACSAWTDRGRPRKVTPKAFTKQAAARPPVRASIAADNTTRRPVGPWNRLAAPSRAWKVSHSLTNPLSGGRPEMAMAPSRNSPAVHGMRRASPPSSSMLWTWVRLMTLPAPRKSRPLKAAWFNV